MDRSTGGNPIDPVGPLPPPQYDEQVMGLFSEVFCAMPLCATVDDRVFVVHGGLASEDGVTLDDIQKVRTAVCVCVCVCVCGYVRG
jgi:diadenosine tetraphosphatase ApaH/serine/threonine PP2A family protein phosphatase